MRQVLLAPRELDLKQLGDARTAGSTAASSTRTVTAWCWPKRIASPRRTAGAADQRRAARVLTPSLKVTRPEIYYGEMSHEPVFVAHRAGGVRLSLRIERSRQRSYDGTRRISDFGSRYARALRRDRRGRLEYSADRLADARQPHDDPPLRAERVHDAGRIHHLGHGSLPGDHRRGAAGVDRRRLHHQRRASVFARRRTLETAAFNYIRNSVKATVDAYDGDVHMYVFDDEDPLIAGVSASVSELFHAGFRDARRSARACALSRKCCSATQAEIYRTYHMRDPRIVLQSRRSCGTWRRYTTGQDGQPAPVPPTYMIATLPGETKPEFLLTIPFTPRNKQNLIGLMVARCDGPHLGEIVFLRSAQAGDHPGPHADRRADQSGSELFRRT